MAVKVPIMFREQLEVLSHVELVDAFLQLQEYALQGNEVIQILQETLQIAEIVLKQNGGTLD